MSEANRVPFTVRLRPDDKAIFAEVVEASGLEAGIAARQVLELMIKRLREEGDYLKALTEMRDALSTTRRAA